MVEMAVARIRQKFGSAHSDLARVAIQYAFHGASRAVALAGFRNAEQITKALADNGDPLTDQDIRFLLQVMSPVRENVTTESSLLNGPTQKNRSTDHQ
ncbi:hypothetical protein ACIP88_20840 [Streptomyces uncialis]|uniref:hypothetical protein n=1 Tax=Streptomyces uncialis TaxID=1048205 RepID=UPI00382BB12D